ncbi:MAG: hypothetical protein M5U28_16275 [Sandaracinaceae bacterium]|nr:hypothetical protein [Sandaracinaceae bacterium]
MTASWKAIDERAGLYELEKVVETGWCWRALAVRLTGGSSLLVSPIRGTLARTAEALEAIGTPSAALAPNHFHYMGLREARERYGDLACVASGTAAPRLTAKCGHDFASLDALRERLPSSVTLLEPPGTKTGEVWLRVETDGGVAWAVCDAFFSVSRPLSGMMGLVLRATGTAPGLRIGSTFLWLALADRRAYRRWLEERLEEDAPRVLVPSHGDVIHDEALPERLRELAARRL